MLVPYQLHGFHVGRSHEDVAFDASQRIVGGAATHHAMQHGTLLCPDDQELGSHAADHPLDRTDRT